MKKKYLLAFIALLFILTSCRLSTKALEDAVKKNITETIEKERSYDALGTLWEAADVNSFIEVKSVDLVHKQGNNYSGFVTVKTCIGEYGSEEKYPLEVVYDGFRFVWQIKDFE